MGTLQIKEGSWVVVGGQFCPPVMVKPPGWYYHPQAAQSQLHQIIISFMNKENIAPPEMEGIISVPFHLIESG